MHENIVRLKISMHDVILGEYFEGLNHLSEINEGSFLRERSFFLHEFIQCASITEFIDEIEVIDSFKHVNIFDDVGTVLDSRKNVDFVDSTFLKFRYLFELVSVNYFDSHLLFGFHMNGLVDLSIHTLSQLFLHRVVFDYLPHLSLLLSQ